MNQLLVLNPPAKAGGLQAQAHRQRYKFSVSTDKNDKDSLFLPDLVGLQIDKEESKRNIQQFLEYQESKVKNITDNKQNMINAINIYFGDK